MFTPRGDVIDLPVGSVPIDFAYRIHTDVGNRCVGAKVNGRIVPLDYKLSNGDIVEVITSKQATGPSRDWMNIVGSSDTRNKIRSWFKKERREENIAKGREMLEKETKRLGYDIKVLLKADKLKTVAASFRLDSEEALYASVGYGGVTLNGVMSKLVELYKKSRSLQLPRIFRSFWQNLNRAAARPRPATAFSLKARRALWLSWRDAATRFRATR